MIINNYEDIYNSLKEICNKNYEQFALLCLDENNKVISKSIISNSNDYDTASFSLRDLFKIILTSEAEAIVIAHNHTNGICYPSDTDIKLTKGIKKTCKYFEIGLLDHVILTDGKMFSILNMEGVEL